MTSVAPRTPTAPVSGPVGVGPFDVDSLVAVLTRELRRQRHGDPNMACWGCPVDAAGLGLAVDRAAQAGLL